MNLTTVFKNMDESNALQGYAESKVRRIFRNVINRPDLIEITFEQHSQGKNSIYFRIDSPSFAINLVEKGPYFFDCIDRAVNTLAKRVNEDGRDLSVSEKGARADWP